MKQVAKREKPLNVKAPQGNNGSTSDACGCGHDHDHHDNGHGHSHGPRMSLGQRWLLAVLIVGALLFFLRPFFISQLLVRVTSYSANGQYTEAVRICRKIIALDPDNIQAWTALGYARMDIDRPRAAMEAFNKVLGLDPDDHGAASFELGRAYYAKGDWPAAIKYFEQVRGNGPRAAVVLEADVLKYRHGTEGFRYLNIMQTLLGDLADCYRKTGDTAKAANIEKEYEVYKAKHPRNVF
jgi:tetratricopeptide (TPR) repeat protein